MGYLRNRIKAITYNRQKRRKKYWLRGFKGLDGLHYDYDTKGNYKRVSPYIKGYRRYE